MMPASPSRTHIREDDEEEEEEEEAAKVSFSAG